LHAQSFEQAEVRHGRGRPAVKRSIEWPGTSLPTPRAERSQPGSKAQINSIGTFTNTADHGRGGDQNGGSARVLLEPLDH
jgi:hypothetical protein